MSITNATTQESLVQYPSPYKVVDGNLCMEVTDKHSAYDRKLSNFTPYIKSELTIDDGATETKYLRLAGTHTNGEVLPEIEVSGKDFPSFNWLFEKWGAKCILEVGKNIREHLRYAIQQTAEYAEQQFIYRQTGWKKINGEWFFLLPGDSKFNVSLKGKLESYCGEQNYSKSDLETVYSMTKTPPAPKEVIKNEPENILIFENTHEAIIDRKTFDIVQKHFKGRKRPDAQGNMDKYAGYLYCGDCGKRMYLHRSKTMPAEKNYFQCGGYQQGKSRCTVHNIKEQVLDTLVLAQLKSMISMASNHSDEFYAIATEKGKAEAKKYYDSAEKEKSQLTARLHDLDNIIRCLYEDRVIGRITPERYDFLASGYEEEQAQIRTKLNELNEKINEIDLQEKYVKEFIAKAKEYINIEKLTPEILRAFIKRIDVYEKEVKYSHTCGNTIVIQYTFQLDKN